MSTDLSEIVTALVRPHMASRIVNALHNLPEFPDFCLTRVRGQDRGRGAGDEYISTKSDLSYQEFIKLEIVCAANPVKAITFKIIEDAWTGREDDRVLFWAAVNRFGRIRVGALKREGPA